jgi:hypothetical protein
MKHLISSLTLGLMLALVAGIPCSLPAQQTYAHAGEYMTAVHDGYAQFKEDLWNYIRTAAHGKNASKIDESRRELIQTTNLAEKKVSRMPAYDGDASLRDGTSAYLKLTYAILTEDYANIVDLEEIAEQSYDLMEAYLLAKEKANERMDEAAASLDKEEAAFAARHNVRLIEAEKSKTILNLEVAGAVMSYYNQVYLLFFKNYKQEAYWLEAARVGDVNALVQNQRTLTRYATEGLAVLDTLPDFDGDASFKSVCAEMLAFYQMEAQEKGPILSGFYLQKENFEKTKAAFDAKKAQDRSREEVDQYNQVVAGFNQAISDFNSTTESLNVQRSKLLDSWNKAAPRFLDRHVP